MMKVYTGCLALIIEEHCIEHEIIFSDQAGAKKGMWGCADELLINKTVCEEVKQHCRNLCTVWLDYKKAYDSIPHEWILTALRLAKIPEHLVAAIKRLIKSWITELNLQTKDGNVSVGDIIYHKGVLQGDYLRVILFILSLNPLSYLLKKEDGYNMGSSEERDKLLVKVLTHLFFVDDLKLYAPTFESD